MRVQILFAFSLAMAGCASVGDTMSKEPSAVYATAKTPGEFRECIALAAVIGSIPVVDFRGGYLFTSSHGFGESFTAMPSGEGSEVKVWGRASMRATARQCI